MIFEPLFGLNIGLFILALIILGIWELVWKCIALWYSARRKQKMWFVLILILNTAGILPIIYLLIYKGRKSKR